MPQPVVTCRDRAVMHVMTEVRDDEREGGKATLVEAPERQNAASRQAKYRNRTCVVANRGEGGSRGGRSPAPVHAESWVPTVGPDCGQSVQSLVTPCVEPEIKAVARQTRMGQPS
jgi:hypothetical protein